MSATVLQFRLKPKPKQEKLQQLGPEASRVLYENLSELYMREPAETVPYGGAGIDGMYFAPKEDPA